MQKKLVENILKGSDSLIALVNDLLDLSRIDAGKMKLIYEPCNLPSTTREIFEQFSSLMKQKSIEFTLDEKIDVKQVFLIDKDKLILVFTNLLSNAYKYTPEHGKANFSLSTIVKNGLPWLQFSVQDTGIGIPQEEIPHVFDRFATISTHNNIKSTIQST
jgi:signal transduction histidine kinase